MTTLEFLRGNLRFLGFGFTLAFFSCFGQTFLVSLFGASLRGEFGLSHGTFGLTYSVATLLGGITLAVVGRQIDRVDLRYFTSIACVALAVACLLVALTPSLVVLYVAMFAIRLSGQGMMAHISATSMARYFDKARGRAISLSSLGFPVSQTVMPIIAVALLGAFGWRQTWLIFAAAVALFVLPLVLWLLSGHQHRHAAFGAETTPATKPGPAGGALEIAVVHQWTQAEVVRDTRFYLLMPVVLAPPFLMTGLFFHQVHIVESKGWSLEWFATAITGFALSTILALLIGGSAVDRFSARRLLPFYLGPLLIGLVILALFNHPLAAYGFLLSAGLTTGASRALVGSIWAEIYGVAHLGAIRSLTGSIGIVSTAISPVLFGRAFDLGVSVERLVGICILYIVFSTLLVLVSIRATPARP